jgi:hypothetical protein
MVIAKQHGGILLWAATPFAARKNGGLDFSKPPLIKCKMSVEKGLPSSGFFYRRSAGILLLVLILENQSYF